MNIVDINGLAAALNMPKATLLRYWRGYPHFFVSPNSRHGKCARFDVEEVVAYLKNRHGDNGVQDQAGQAVSSPPLDGPAESSVQGRICDKSRRQGVAGKRAQQQAIQHDRHGIWDRARKISGRCQATP
jgi:hypothetical protein